MSTKMTKLIVTQSVTVVRDGKRVTPPLNKAFPFTDDEIAIIKGANPQGLRKPVNESSAEDTVDGEEAPAKKETAAAKKKRLAAEKKAADEAAAAAAAEEDEDEGEEEEEEDEEDEDI